jgi:hypothetical protein
MRLTLVAPGGSASSLEAPPDAHQRAVVVPVERDLLSILQARNKDIITPRATRPLCTTVCIDSSSIARPRSAAVAVSRKTATDVEAEVENDVRPAVMLDPATTSSW